MSENHKEKSDQIDQQKQNDEFQTSPDKQAESAPSDDASVKNPSERGQRILIGSQRDVAAQHANKKRDWYVPDQEKKSVTTENSSAGETSTTPTTTAASNLDDNLSKPETESESKNDDISTPSDSQPVQAEEPSTVAAGNNQSPADESVKTDLQGVLDAADTADMSVPEVQQTIEEIEPAASTTASPGRHFPPPNIRGKLSPDLEAELEAALADASLDEILAESDSISNQPVLEPESRHTGRVVAVERDNVFVELAAREQGVVPLKMFDEPPQPGDQLQVIVSRFNREDGLYELLAPGASADVSGWSDLAEGMMVEAVVTGHNTGGLECEVNKIRGFIPVSHISLYRVENLEEFVGERFVCLVTEANQRRGNLVLSRRAVLEKEKEDARRELLASLEPGQIHEGVVRKIMDFGAFVDLGGVDGLIHISQLSWGRVENASEVLSEGQTVSVKILKMDEAGSRISLGYRDLIESPWTDVENKYPAGSLAKGKVSKLMEFGAFVELEPGIEGLVHISELSHKRVWRTSDVVSEGQEVEVVIKSVDTKAQRIGLSMKDALPDIKTENKKEKEDKDEGLAEPAVQTASKKPAKELKGGLGSTAGGERFGLNW